MIRSALCSQSKRLPSLAVSKASAEMTEICSSIFCGRPRKRLKIYYAGFGFRALRREAITAIGSVAGLGEAANAAGHTHVDRTLIYTLDELGPREEAIKAFQERIMGKPEGTVQ